MEILAVAETRKTAAAFVTDHGKRRKGSLHEEKEVCKTGAFTPSCPVRGGGKWQIPAKSSDDESEKIRRMGRRGDTCFLFLLVSSSSLSVYLR
jgi:hypothetical protein